MNPDNVITTYDEIGPEWAAGRSRHLMERRWLDRLLNVAPHPYGKRRVLDIGCGSGRPIASYLADRGAKITGVDAALSMITLFAKMMPESQAIHADMRGLSLGKTFDAIIAWDSFFHLCADDQRAMFTTFAAHSGPGTALMFTSGDVAGTVVGEVVGKPIFHASLDPDEYRALLADAGFKVVSFTPNDPTCGGHTIWLCRFSSPGTGRPTA